MWVAEGDRLAFAAAVLDHQQAGPAEAQRAEVGVHAVPHVQVAIAVEVERAEIATRVDDPIPQHPGR